MGLPWTIATLVSISTVDPIAPETLRSVLESCSIALGESACEEPQNNGEPPRFLAELEWFPQKLIVRLRRPESTNWLVERHLEFTPADREDQRWVAAGLLVAALTAAHPEPKEEPLPIAPPEPTRPLAPLTPSPPTGYTHRLGLDLGARTGPGFQDDQYQLGGLLRAWAFPSSAPYFLTLSWHGATSLDTEPSFLWTSASLGVGLRLTERDSPLQIRILAEGVGQLVSVRATRDSLQETASAWRGGGRVGLDLAWPQRNWLAPWIGIDWTWLSPPLEVKMGTESIGTENNLRFGLSLGARLGFGGLPEKKQPRPD